MSEDTSNNLAPINPGMLTRPDYIEGGRAGFDAVDANDVLCERITLIQDLSPEAKEHKFEPGSIIRRRTEEVVWAPGQAPIKFSIAAYWKAYTQFGDRNVPGEPIVIATTTDRTSPMAEEARKWVKIKQRDGREVRKVHDVHSFVILLDGRPHEPLLMTCLRSNAKSGQSLLSLANGRGDAPMFAGLYTLQSGDQTNTKNQTYYVYKFKNDPATWASPEMVKAGKTMSELIKSSLAKGKTIAEYDSSDAVEEGAHATIDVEL